jgi:hypothetical protein
MAVARGRRDQVVVADAYQAGQGEGLGMVPIDLADVDPTDELVERQADAGAYLAIEERAVLLTPMSISGVPVSV